MKNYVVIDDAKCVKCGLCVRDCPGFALALAGDKIRQINEHCMLCGHCLAICPQRAVSLIPPAGIRTIDDVEEYSPENFRVDPDSLLRSMKMRRSTRQFLASPLEPDMLRRVIEAGRFSPTSINGQDVSYIILEHDKQEIQHHLMDNFRSLARVAAWFGNFLPIGFDAKKMSRAKDDYLFKGAPAVIVVTAPRTFAADGILAAANIEQMAHNMGLGVLHVGFFVYLANFSPWLRSRLHIGLGRTICDCLAVGFPAVHYQRTAPRKGADITWR